MAQGGFIETGGTWPIESGMTPEVEKLQLQMQAAERNVGAAVQELADF